MWHAPARHATKYVTRTSTKLSEQANSTNTTETHYTQARHKRTHTRFTTSHLNKKHGGHPRPPPAIQLTKVPGKNSFFQNKKMIKTRHQMLTNLFSVYQNISAIFWCFQRLSTFLLRNNTKQRIPTLQKNVTVPHQRREQYSIMFSLTPATTKFSYPTPESNANIHDCIS
jgi:hypothetical protein